MAVQRGVPSPNMPVWPLHESPQEEQLARDILQEYLGVGAVKKLQGAELHQTGYLVPWFVLSKPEAGGGVKHRRISDLRQINQSLDPPKLRLENWRDIFPHLQKGKPARWTLKMPNFI